MTCLVLLKALLLAGGLYKMHRDEMRSRLPWQKEEEGGRPSFVSVRAGIECIQQYEKRRFSLHEQDQRRCALA